MNRGETRLAISGVVVPVVLRPKPLGTIAVACRVTVSGQIVHLLRSVQPTVQPETIVGVKVNVTSAPPSSGMVGSEEAVALFAGVPTGIWVLPMPANAPDSALPPPPCQLATGVVGGMTSGVEGVVRFIVIVVGEEIL